jgi:nucleoside-diphosphate-sugar epimerase
MAARSDRAGEAAAPGWVVVVTGAAGALGRRVCALAAADPRVARVVAVDRGPLPGLPPPAVAHQVDLGTVDLKPLLEGADALVHLAQGDAPDVAPADRTGALGDGELAQRVLDAASAVGIRRVVLLSSATAYGAWANNPVPLTEEAPLRPNPGVGFAAEKAELERVAAEWREDHPGATVAVLRPTVTVRADGPNSWLARALARTSRVPVTDAEPPAQCLDVADLASAVDLARRAGLDGPRNVAPDGWVDGETARALAGGSPRVRLPERVALRLARLRWRWGMAPTPPALLPYTVHPWVVANDRLRADGWTPAASNEEALVAAHDAGPWATLSPRRRQELALAASAAVLGGAVLGVVALVRRRARRAR